MAFISMTLNVTHTFDAGDIDTDDQNAVDQACLNAAQEMASNTGLTVDTDSIEA